MSGNFRRATGLRRPSHRLNPAVASVHLLAAAALLCGPGLVVPAGATSFDEATVRFEQNASDGDFEVVFEATGGSEGLARLTVTAPDGRIVIDFKAPGPTLGIRHLVFESPEPPDLDTMTEAYPEGVYRFSGFSIGGETFAGAATLSHELPPTVTGLSPSDEDSGVPVRGLVISWKAVPGVTGYVVEVEQEEQGVSVNAALSPSATSFAVPDGFLEADTEYQFAVGTLAESGNLSVVERSFTTE